MNAPHLWLAGTIDECIELARAGAATTIVTNPTVMASWCESGSMDVVIRRVCTEANVPLFVQLEGPTLRDFMKQAEHLKSLSPLTRLKIPATIDGLAATRALVSAGEPVLVTAMGSLGSIAAAAAAGATWVCPYIARTREAGTDPIAMIRDASALLSRCNSPTQIIPASVRSADEAQAVFAAGAHGVIVFNAVFRALVQDGVCTKAVEGFNSDWTRIHQRSNP
jgi:transaldolase